MRAVRRWARRRYAGIRIARRRVELERELSGVLGTTVSLAPAGSRGRDSIFLARGDEATVGVLRLSNPYLHRTPVPADMPFVTLGRAARLDREWRSYRAGYRAGLTPKPLWRTGDALLCEYRPGTRMSDLLLGSPRDFWRLICIGAEALGSLHRAGLVHMDACLANILRSPDGESCTFIDFEYGPAPTVGEDQQRIYDHLRLAESSLKFLPAGEATGFADWIRILEALLPPAARRVDLAPLRPGLRRLFAHPVVGPAVRGVFFAGQDRVD